MIVTGERDDVVPASVVQSYVATRLPDEPLHTAVARGADHFDVVDPEHPAYLLLLAEVEELDPADPLTGRLRPVLDADLGLGACRPPRSRASSTACASTS